MAEIDRAGLPESYEKHSDKDKSHNCNPHSSVPSIPLHLLSHACDFRIWSILTRHRDHNVEGGEIRIKKGCASCTLWNSNEKIDLSKYGHGQSESAFQLLSCLASLLLHPAPFHNIAMCAKLMPNYVAACALGGWWPQHPGWSPVFTVYSVPTYWVSSSAAATTQVNWGDTKVQQSIELHLCVLYCLSAVKVNAYFHPHHLQPSLSRVKVPHSQISCVERVSTSRVFTHERSDDRDQLMDGWANNVSLNTSHTRETVSKPCIFIFKGWCWVRTSITPLLWVDYGTLVLTTITTSSYNNCSFISPDQWLYFY